MDIICSKSLTGGVAISPAGVYTRIMLKIDF
jgi:hypothetical protein